MATTILLGPFVSIGTLTEICQKPGLGWRPATGGECVVWKKPGRADLDVIVISSAPTRDGIPRGLDIDQETNAEESIRKYDRKLMASSLFLKLSFLFSPQRVIGEYGL